MDKYYSSKLHNPYMTIWSQAENMVNIIKNLKHDFFNSIKLVAFYRVIKTAPIFTK